MVGAGTFGSQLAQQNAQQQQPRITRTQRVQQAYLSQQQAGHYQELKQKAEAIKSELQGLDLADYTKKYNSLDPELKQFFLTPSELSQTPEYIQYAKDRVDYEQKIADAQRELSEWQQAESWVYNHPEFIGFLPPSIQAKAREIAKHKGSTIYEWEQAKVQKQELADALAKIGIYPAYSPNDFNYVESYYKNIGNGQYINIPASNISAEMKNQQIQAQALFDANQLGLTLGGKKDYPIISVGKETPLTQEQQNLNELYLAGTPIQSVKNWISNLFPSKEQNTNIVWEKNTKVSQGMNGSGTGIITVTPSAESKIYMDQQFEFQNKADEVSKMTFADYETRLTTAINEGLTFEKLVELKRFEHSKFNYGIDLFQKDFQANYKANMVALERSKIWAVETTPLGLIVTPARKWYYHAEDLDRGIGETPAKRITTIKWRTPLGMNGHGTITQTASFEYIPPLKRIPRKAKNLFGTEAEINEKNLKIYGMMKEHGIPSWMAREQIFESDLIKGTIQGVYAGVYENRRTIALKTVAWAGVVTGATILGSYTGGILTAVSAKAIKWGSTALTGLYAGSIIVRTAVEPSVYRAGLKLGDIVAQEIAPLVAGGYVGAKIGGKVTQWIEDYKTMMQKPEYIAPYKRTRMTVLEGTERFPTAPTNRHLSEFKKQKYSLFTDEKILKKLRQLDKTYAGAHATSTGRFAKEGEKFVIGAGTSELPIQYYSSEDSLYFAVGKGTETSFYGGSIFGAGASKPYIASTRATGLVKIPKGFTPALTKAEVISYLKEFYPDYPLKWIIRNKGSYWKEASFLIERGRTGELVVIGRKSEIEAGHIADTIMKRTAQTPYYTKVANPEFYKQLEKISRYNQLELLNRVKAVEIGDIFRPKILATKIWQRIVPRINEAGDLTFGRRVGQIAPSKIGRIVPIERYVPVPEKFNPNRVAMLKDYLSGGNVNAPLLKINEIKLMQDVKIIPSSYFQKVSSSASSYGEEYGYLISYPKSSIKSPSASYSKGYSYSSLKSAVSSLISSPPSSRTSSTSSFSSSYAYYNPLSSNPSGSSSSKSYPRPKPRPVPIELNWTAKEKVMRKLKKTPEIIGLFPDFTARALGFAPKRVKSVKEALREMERIQTGFNVRTGVSFKPNSDKNIMKGIMA